MFRPTSLKLAAAFALLAAITASGGIRRKKYENPINKDTQQPDKVLFDKAIKDIEKGRYEIARLNLNVLINTYDTSEFLAKAKLAVADSWYREGGSHGYAQAEAEYKDFILFYPTMEEAPEAQDRICAIHVKQMEKADRDTVQALRAEQECRTLITTYPNSKFAPRADQKLREIQEALAEGERMVGEFYHKRGSNPAAANRLAGVINQYPLYSGAADTLWLQADSYSRMGKNFRGRTGEAYQKIVRDYPLSKWVDPAKKKLKEMEMDIPDPDPVAVARMQYEKENYVKASTLKRSSAFLTRGPDMSHAAKSGAPAMATLKPSIPASVPIPVDTTPAPAAAAGAGGSTDVTISTAIDKNNSSLETKPDARMSPPSAAGAAPAAGVTPAAAAAPPAPTAAAATGPEPLPVNHTGNGKIKPLKQKKDRKSKTPPTPAPPATPAAAKTDAAAPAAK